MTRHSALVATALLLTACVALSAHTAHAQTPRSRHLVYDSTRKDWTEMPPPPQGTAEGDLHAIRLLIKDAQFRQAKSAIKRFIKEYGETDALYPAVMIAKAEMLIGRGDHYKAHETLQAFLNEFSGTALTTEALRLEFVIAETYLAGKKRKFWGLPLFSGEDTAFKILDELSVDHAESEVAELAIKTKADYLFARGEHSLAELEYSRLLRAYPRSQYRQFCLKRSAEAALAGFYGVDYDETALIEAEERYREYRGAYPLAADQENVDLILDGIRERRAEKEFSIGQYYERTDHPRAAILHYQLALDRWGDTLAAEKAKSRLNLLRAPAPGERKPVP